MANIWLTSDHHFFHENMYRFEHEDGRRVRYQFKDAAEGDAYMVQAWNEVVKPEDHVWHLGDFTMERSSTSIWKLERIMQQLNGHKRLILGNHDHYDVRVYRNIGFEKVRAFHRHEGLVYSHVPLHPVSIASDKVIANVHGHIHRNASFPGKYLNACVEVTDYRPVSFDEVRTRCRALSSV